MVKVLVAEDNEEALEVHGREFNRHVKDVEILFARDIETALRLLNEHKDSLGGIVVDGCLNPENFPDGTELVQEAVRLGVSCPIIACSAGNHMNELLREVGATHKVPSLSRGLAQKDRAARIFAHTLKT